MHFLCVFAFQVFAKPSCSFWQHCNSATPMNVDKCKKSMKLVDWMRITFIMIRWVVVDSWLIDSHLCWNCGNCGVNYKKFHMWWAYFEISWSYFMCLIHLELSVYMSFRSSVEFSWHCYGCQKHQNNDGKILSFFFCNSESRKLLSASISFLTGTIFSTEKIYLPKALFVNNDFGLQ